MEKFNPFTVNQDKEQLRDPLDVRNLLTDNSRKAVITSNGELQLQDSNPGESPKVELMKERYWGKPDPHKTLFNQRLAVETRAMNCYFPDFQFRQAHKPLQKHNWVIAQPGENFWIGVLKTYSSSSYTVAVVYPKDYPFGEIRAYILEPYIPITEHRFKDGHLCLYDHEGSGQGFEEGKTTAVTITAWTAAWLHAYEIWRNTGRWPVLNNA